MTEIYELVCKVISSPIEDIENYLDSTCISDHVFIEAFKVSCIHQRFDVSDLLLQKKPSLSKHYHEVLVLCSKYNILNGVNYIKNKNYNIFANDYIAVFEAVYYNQVQTIDYFFKNGCNSLIDNLLVTACVSPMNCKESINYLITKGADIHFSEDLPLRRAIECKNKDVVDLLLKLDNFPPNLNTNTFRPQFIYQN